LKSANEFWSIAILVVGIIAFFTTAMVSTIRRNRGRRPSAGADPVNWWSPSGRDGHHGGGHHGGHHGGWGGGDGGGHHGGWSGGGDGGSAGGGHHG
jgi:hypothetical protein